LSRRVTLLPLALAVVLAGPVRAVQLESAVLDPKTYRSPSGECELFVDPSASSGAGSATYRFTSRGAVSWTGTRPWTLWDAAVTDDGLVAGYAYAKGHDGGLQDALTIVIVDPTGTSRLEESCARTGVAGHHGDPRPMVKAFFVDPQGRRVFVHLSAETKEEEAWWTYDLETGAAVWKLHARSQMKPEPALSWIQTLRPLTSTPLILVQWRWMDFASHRYGAVFTLHDGDGHVRWRLDWPDDYTRADEEEEQRVEREIRDQGAILDVQPHGRFALRQTKTEERIDFQIGDLAEPTGELEVREIGRSPYEAPPAEVPATLPRLELAHLGTIHLGEATAPPPIHDVMSFGIDGLGRLGAVCRSGGRDEFVLVDRAGARLGSVELRRAPEGKSWTFRLACVGGGRWVLTGTGDIFEQDAAWWIDTSAWSVTPIEGFRSPTVESLAGTRDGGFLVLGTTWYRGGYSTSDLVSYGPDGARRWALGGDQGNPGDPSTLFAPEAVCFTSDDRVVVLGNTQNVLKHFTSTGEFLREVSLTEAWGYEPNYPTSVRAGPAGDVVIEDFDGPKPVVHMGEDDRVLASFEPRFGDGRKVPMRGDVQIDLDGRLWVSDGQSLLELNDSGTVARIVGAPPDATRLGRIAAIALGPGDRIHAADERTGAVHVFDARGALVHVCRPDPEDFDRPASLAPLSVFEDGEVLYQSVRFDAAGKRLGKREPMPHWYRGAGGRRWQRLRQGGLQLLEHDGTPLRTVERDSENRWIRGLDRVATALDGSIAITTGQTDDSQHALVFSSTGEPTHALALPPGVPGWSNFAFDGQRFAFAFGGRKLPGAILLLDLEGHAQRFDPPRAIELWQPFFAGGGRELWLFDGDHSLERFALPD